jgi:O-methyltransferase involved in polyketide biosynthesis
MRVMPDAARAARANRDFLAAAVRYAAGQGIGQYVDIGAGFPTSPNVHECARETVPEAKVAYLDNDPVVVSHTRALLAADELVTVISADAREYETVLSALELSEVIDLSEPVCVLFVSMLHFLADADADALVAAVRERMAPGSYLVLSAGCLDDSNRAARPGVESAYGARTVLSGRSPAEIAAYFGDFELMPPGLVPVTEWPVGTPEGGQPSQRAEEPSAPAMLMMLAGIGRKP